MVIWWLTASLNKQFAPPILYPETTHPKSANADGSDNYGGAIASRYLRAYS